MPMGKDTYTGSSEMRESLLSILRDVSPTEDNYFTSNLGTGPVALQPSHYWNLYYVSRPTSVIPLGEGVDTVYADQQAETRSSNKTAIVGRPVRVSRTKASIAMVTGEDAVGKEKERSLTLLKSDMEWLTINGALTAGSSGLYRGMSGLVQCISTNVTARASGTSFTETELNDMIQESWNAVGSQYVADLLVSPVIIKRKIAGFGTNLTRNVNAVDKRLTQEVRVYDSQVGPTVTVIAHKDVNAAAGTLAIYAVREDLFQQSFLVDSGEPHWEERPSAGDYVSGTYITEFTLVSYDQHASVRRSGYQTTLS